MSPSDRRMPSPRQPARFSPEDLSPPPLSWRDAVTRLRHFAILSWAVEPEALDALLPPWLTAERFTLDSGREVALISAVPFEDLDFHFRFAPFYKVAMGQTNYRAYVRCGERRAVWFFGTTLTGRWVRVPRDRWRLPWHQAVMRFEASWGPEGVCDTYRLEAESDWAPMQLVMRGTTRPMGRLDGFFDAEDTAVTLTHPLTGYYWRSDGRPGSYSVWHAPLTLHHAEVSQVSAPLYERLGLITPQTPLHSALVQQETLFHVHLPPKVVPAQPARTP